MPIRGEQTDHSPFTVGLPVSHSNKYIVAHMSAFDPTADNCPQLFLCCQRCDSNVLQETTVPLHQNQFHMGKILAFELINPRTAYGVEAASNTNSRSEQNQESMQTLNHFIRQTPDLVFAFSGCVQRVTAWYPFDPDFIADHC